MLVDPTCEKSLEEGTGSVSTRISTSLSPPPVKSAATNTKDCSAAGGCALRLCSETANTNERVCGGSDHPDVDPCTLKECRYQCANSNAFACTHYAYDPVDTECILFESCAAEDFSDDFTLYVITPEELEQYREITICDQSQDTGKASSRRLD